MIFKALPKTRMAVYCLLLWGRPGFDVGCETWGACRGADDLV